MRREEQPCEECGIPRYKHPYSKDCGHDFTSVNEDYEESALEELGDEE